MRKPIEQEHKRSVIIGIKVKQETKQKLEYLAARDGATLSTFINDLLLLDIENHFRCAKIDWNTLPEEEKVTPKKGKETRK